MKILLHICCGPCTIYPARVLRAEGHEAEGLFFNPNIHPFSEFLRRRDTLASLAGTIALPVSFDEEYDLEAFLSGALRAGEDRCGYCYRVRLERAFRKAAAEGYAGVTTTLLYSRYQKHERIAAVAEEVSALYNVPFLYRDFRTGWKEGQQEARRLNLYRQNYCGCIFSEAESYRR